MTFLGKKSSHPRPPQSFNPSGVVCTSEGIIIGGYHRGRVVRADGVIWARVGCAVVTNGVCNGARLLFGRIIQGSVVKAVVLIGA